MASAFAFEPHENLENVVTPEEVAAFNRDGFVLPKRGLDPQSTRFMVESVEAVFRANYDWHNLLRMPHVPQREGQKEGVVGGENLFRIAIHPTFISPARPLVGPT